MTRLERERKTLQKMMRLYCSHHHTAPAGRLCPKCTELSDYAIGRLERCPYHEKKPTCANCPIHCYQPTMKESIRAVMRFSGPRMLLHDPYLALMHLWDGRIKPKKRTEADLK